jgi:diguanylate cyclase (GGDEF)-like protein
VSFRTRLTWFFIVIVIVPMIAVAVILFSLVNRSERGKADARLAQAQTAAQSLFRETQARSEEAARQIAQSRALAEALQGDEARLEAALQQLSARSRAVRVRLTRESGSSVDVGARDAIASSRTNLVGPGGRSAGSLEAAISTAEDFTRQLGEFTGMEVRIDGGDATAVTVPEIARERLPQRGTREIGDTEYRVSSFAAPGFGEQEGIRVFLLDDLAETENEINSDSWIVGGLLIAFLLLAFAFALTVSRSLQSQVQRLLEAARRLGSGQYGVEVPTEGNDEFAALGSEFNSMARTLEARLEDLQSERARLQDAIRRVGESLTKGLDRDALLDIVVETAVDGIAADCGRATVRDVADGPLLERARLGDLPAFKAAIHSVEAAVLDSKTATEADVEDAHALAHPLHAGDNGSGRVVGIVSVARRGRPFSGAEKELFHYLAGQASVSLENADLHEAVKFQAVTDELTGLANHRRFQEVMAAEVERTKRTGAALGLIMLDLDDFKRVNDTYGHLQGDLVLKEVARVLLETSREIDEPARYGGEEMAVALPETDLDGAHNFAERLRQRIESLRIPLVDADGVLHVTASFGAAALPDSSDADKDALVAAADAALYRAKRAGKNRVVRAG